MKHIAASAIAILALDGSAAFARTPGWCHWWLSHSNSQCTQAAIPVYDNENNLVCWIPKSMRAVYEDAGPDHYMFLVERVLAGVAKKVRVLGAKIKEGKPVMGTCRGN